jgi:hypothetical protein
LHRTTPRGKRPPSVHPTVAPARRVPQALRQLRAPASATRTRPTSWAAASSEAKGTAG